MSEKLFLLDNGHGGVINGVYQTAGKRSPSFYKTPVLYEGEFNRFINTGIAFELTKENIPYIMLVSEYEDISLDERVKRANKWARSHETYLISTHSNAGGGNGFECYTTIGDTGQSDKMAAIFYEEACKEFPTRRMRTDYSDNDIDKEFNFRILKNTIMPSVLNEWFFMDNEEELKSILLTWEGRRKIINANVEAIKKIYYTF